MEDIGAHWDGAWTAAHEFAHNLGSHHDGDENTPSESCSWEDGHIMSYHGWGTLRKFEWSECTKKSITEFIESDKAECLTT